MMLKKTKVFEKQCLPVSPSFRFKMLVNVSEVIMKLAFYTSVVVSIRVESTENALPRSSTTLHAFMVV